MMRNISRVFIAGVALACGPLPLAAQPAPTRPYLVATLRSALRTHQDLVLENLAHQLNDRLVRRALVMDGTCNGEHGIGYATMKYLEAEHGEALDVTRAVKRALDPDNRMNPGKMVEV